MTDAATNSKKRPLETAESSSAAGSSSSQQHPAAKRHKKDKQQQGDRKQQGQQGKGKKNKKPFEGKNPETDGLCSFVLRGKPCPMGDGKCAMKHDMSEFLKAKGPDLGERCPFFDATGSCKFGFQCRFAGAHMKDGKMVTEDRKARSASLVGAFSLCCAAADCWRERRCC